MYFIIEKVIMDEDNNDTEPVNSKVGNQQVRKSKIGMKYDLHTDFQRINLIFDITHHKLSPAQLTTTYGINYNTIRNIDSLFQSQEGETYKHARMYKDINNVVLKIAMKHDRRLAKKIQNYSEKCN